MTTRSICNLTSHTNNWWISFMEFQMHHYVTRAIFCITALVPGKKQPSSGSDRPLWKVPHKTGRCMDSHCSSWQRPGPSAAAFVPSHPQLIESSAITGAQQIINTLLRSWLITHSNKVMLPSSTILATLTGLYIPLRTYDSYLVNLS